MHCVYSFTDNLSCHPWSDKSDQSDQMIQTRQVIQSAKRVESGAITGHGGNEGFFSEAVS